MPAKLDGSPPQKFTSAHKQYIVLRLAMYGEPSEIIKELEVFEPPLKGVSHQAISKYNPSIAMGASLSEDLKTLFWDTRERWGKEIQAVPLAHQRTRFELLYKYLSEGSKGLAPGLSPKFLLEGIELAEKMSAGFFKPQQADASGANGLLLLRELLKPQPGEDEAPAWGPLETPKDGKPT